MIRLLSVALAAAIVAIAALIWQLDRSTDALHEQERMAADELIAEERRHRAKEQEYAANARKAGEIYAAQSSRVRADADSARSELDRLRNAVNSGGVYAAEGAASAARADVANRLAGVVNECAAALSTVAANADDTAAKLTALQAYVAGITKD